MENSEVDEYITEKNNWCLAGTVPIYYGDYMVDNTIFL